MMNFPKEWVSALSFVPAACIYKNHEFRDELKVSDENSKKMALAHFRF